MHACRSTLEDPTRYTAIHFALAKTDPARQVRAVTEARKFLVRFPEHPVERQQLIDLYLKRGDVKSARQHLAILFSSPGGFASDPELLEKAAVCDMAEQKPDDAVRHLEKAVATGQAPVRVYGLLLDLLRAQRRDTHVAYHLEAIQRPPFDTNLEARVLVGRFLLARGERDEARKHIARAREEMPGGATDVDVLMASAEVEMVGLNPALDKAQAFLEKAAAEHPRAVPVGLRLSDVLLKRGKPAEAVEVLKRTAATLDDTDATFVAVVDRLLDMGQADEAERLAAKMEADDTLTVMTRYVRGRLALRRGDWPAARGLLEGVAPALRTPQTKDFHKRAMVDLGRCYELAHNPDQQLAAHADALRDDPNFVPALVGQAEALVKLGRLAEALPLLRGLVRDVPSLRPTYARLHLVQALGQPEGKRDWSAFDEAVGPPPLATELRVMKAESLALRGDAEGAAFELDEATAADPKNPAVYVAAIRVKGGKPSEVAAALDAATAKVGDVVELRLAKAAFLTQRPKPPTADEFTALAADADKFPPADRRRLFQGLADTAFRAGDQPGLRAAALGLYQRAAAADPRDLPSRVAVVELGMAEKKPEAVEAALAEIAAVEGPNGPLYLLARVATQLPGVAPGDKARVAALRREAERAGQVRRAWPQVYVVLAQLDELDGLTDAALSNYRQAIDLGERREWVVRRAFELMRERRQFKEAAAMLNRLRSVMPLPDELERFRTIMNVLASDTPAANRAEIDRVAPAGSRDYQVQLLRGSLLAATRADDEAEKAFREAVGFKSDIPDTWTALVGHLVRLGNVREAKRATAEAEEVLLKGDPSAKVLLATAGCRELVGDRAGAEAGFRRAAAKEPNDLAANRELVLFLQRTGRANDADRQLEGLTAATAPEVARWARRHRAVSLAGREDAYARRGEALRLVEQNLAAANDPEDVKAKAVVQTVDPATRAEGMKTLQDFARFDQLTPEEYSLLGRLFFEQGRFAEAEPYYLQAVQPRPGVSVAHLVGLVRLYLVMNSPGEAAKALNRLKATAPRSWEATREEARLLARTGRKDEARAKVLAFPGVRTDPAATRRAGEALDELGYPADAETMFRAVLDGSKSPDAHLPLAIHYVSHQQPAKAVELARRHEAGVPVTVTARILSGAARGLPAGDPAAAAVEQWLTRALEANRGNETVYPDLLSAVAELRDVQGRTEEAIGLYREARTKTGSPVATNNLAMLLALYRPEEAADAVGMMTALIEVNGPIPTFLDTRAVARLVAGQPKEAVKDLELAIAQQRRPVYFFHLAWAYNLLGDRNEAKAREDAVAAGLTPDMLHPKERSKYQELIGR